MFFISKSPATQVNINRRIVIKFNPLESDYENYDLANSIDILLYDGLDDDQKVKKSSLGLLY